MKQATRAAASLKEPLSHTVPSYLSLKTTRSLAYTAFRIPSRRVGPPVSLAAKQHTAIQIANSEQISTL